MKKQILSILLVVVMLLTAFPLTSFAATDLSVSEVVDLINDATGYASQASYDWSRESEYLEPVDMGSSTDILNSVIQAVDPNASLDSVIGGFFDMGSKNDRVKDGNFYYTDYSDKYLLEHMSLRAEDIEAISVTGNEYIVSLKDCSNPQKDNSTALDHATNDFITVDEIDAAMQGAGAPLEVNNSSTLKYKDIIITATIENGLVTNLQVSYKVDINLSLKISIINTTGTGKILVNSNYSNFDYSNVPNLPEIPEGPEIPDEPVLNGWILEGNKWAYYENDIKVTNKWLKDSVGWCYVGADGYCLTNAWAKDSKGWCYLDANGRMTLNKWVQDGGKWYYLDANGYMVTGTKKIGGKTYKFASNGVWIG